MKRGIYFLIPQTKAILPIHFKGKALFGNKKLAKSNYIKQKE